MDEHEREVPNESRARHRSTRNLVSFWIFGLCNNYGYVVMLTAAMDFLDSDNVSDDVDEKKINLNLLKLQLQRSVDGRKCTPMSTGAILLADIIPSLIIKILSPFLPYNANIRVLISCMTSAVSFVAVGFAETKFVVIFGVALASFASGLGEPTFLAHSTHYDKNVVSTWSSGTGGAGIIGAVSYSLLRAIGLSTRQTLLFMIFIPTMELITFFLILSRPVIRERQVRREGISVEHRPLVNDLQNNQNEFSPLNSISEKCSYIPKLTIYFIPLATVYFFEYFINQGLVSKFLMT